MISWKKLLVCVFVMVFALALAACGPEPAAEPQEPEPAAQEESPAEEESPAAVDYSAWPEKDIVMYVNTKAGSSSDTLVRQAAAALEGKLNGHKIIINNIVDGTGVNTWPLVLDSEPDGYTLACLNTSIVTSYLLGVYDVDYHDFSFVSGFYVDPQLVYCRSEEPYNDFGELMEYVKEHPGEVNWGTAGATSCDSIMLAELFSQHPELQVNRISYNTGSELLTAMLGSFVDVGVTEYLDLDAQIQAGNLKILGVMSEERVANLPDVPTLKECGYDIVMERARGFAGPRGMDEALIDRMNEVFLECFNTQSFQDYMVANCVEIRWMPKNELLASYEQLAEVISANLDALVAK